MKLPGSPEKFEGIGRRCLCVHAYVYVCECACVLISREEIDPKSGRDNSKMRLVWHDRSLELPLRRVAEVKSSSDPS